VSVELCLAPNDALANEESTHRDGTGSGASSSAGSHENGLRSNSSTDSMNKNVNAAWAVSVAVPGLTQCKDNQLRASLEFGGHGDVLHLAFPRCLWPTPVQHDHNNGDEDAFMRSSSRIQESTSNTGMSGMVVALQPWFVPKASPSLPKYFSDSRYDRSSSESATSRQSDVWSRGITSPPIMVALAPCRHFESHDPLPTITPSSSNRNGARNDNSDIISGYLNNGVPSSTVSRQRVGVYGPAELTAATLAHSPRLLAEQPLPVQSFRKPRQHVTMPVEHTSKQLSDQGLLQRELSKSNCSLRVWSFACPARCSCSATGPKIFHGSILSLFELSFTRRSQLVIIAVLMTNAVAAVAILDHAHRYWTHAIKFHATSRAKPRLFYLS